jgi:CubicO group peptidase (beta-lactamase class C family)
MLRAFAVLLMLALPMASQAPPQLAAAAGQIRELIDSGAVPGMAVAVTQHGHIVWEQGFGWADREQHIRATAKTPFYLASVTKSLTSTALMVLARSGKLDLDGPVNAYLGAAKVHSPMWDASQATVRRVATHMAGLTTFYRACDVGVLRCRISVPEEIEQYGILFWPPGERFDYSNLGYTVLGEAMAHVTRQSFANVLEKSVFEPLGMKHCSLTGTHGAAANYDQHSHERTPRLISGTPAASAEYCSVHALAEFAMFQLKDHLHSQQQILPDASIDELHRPVTHLAGQQYAMGWWTENRGGEYVVLGQGGTTDALALVELFPAEDLGIVILANSWSDSLNSVEQAIVANVLAKSEARPQPVAAPKPPQPVDAKLAGHWTGEIRTYRGTVPVEISISSSGTAQGRIGSAADAALRSVSIKGDHVYGIVAGDLRNPDAPPPPYDVEFDLFLRGDKLAGATTTRPKDGNNAQLPHWTELHR